MRCWRVHLQLQIVAFFSAYFLNGTCPMWLYSVCQHQPRKLHWNDPWKSHMTFSMQCSCTLILALVIVIERTDSECVGCFWEGQANQQELIKRRGYMEVGTRCYHFIWSPNFFASWNVVVNIFTHFKCWMTGFMRLHFTSWDFRESDLFPKIMQTWRKVWTIKNFPPWFCFCCKIR